MHILLDEAQDADADQLAVLTELLALGPHNRFSMVGDPQQSIYGSRASVRHYVDIHRRLVADKIVEPLVFSTTFRCSRRVVAVVNDFFPSILDENKTGQVSFVPLSTPADAPLGKIIRLRLVSDEENDPEDFEARALARWCSSSGMEDPVGFLTPRNRWLSPLKEAFKHATLAFQIRSHSHTWRQNPLFAWTTVLTHLFARPDDDFELLGALREWMDLTDKSIVDFVYGSSPKPVRKLQIARRTEGDGEVGRALNHLFEIRCQAMTRTPLEGIVWAVEELHFATLLVTRGLMTPEEIADTRDWTEWQLGTCGRRADWPTCARMLRSHLDNKMALPEKEDEAPYVGYSLHKSKGLEWPTVVLPYFFRPFDGGVRRYPHLRRGRIVFDPRDARDVAEDLRAEWERLLYVGFTRAKSTLVVIDDSALWKSGFSLGRIFVHANKERWNSIESVALPP
jgi:superfamily I DNA/RNA helicase